MLNHPSLVPDEPKQKRRWFIQNTTLIFAAFASTFYSRIFCSITRAPSILNFLHFAVVPFVLVVAMSSTRTKDRRQIETVYLLLAGLLIFFGVMVVSALINDAGIPNVIFNFLILGEPFLFLIAIICIDFSAASIDKLRCWLINSAIINWVLAVMQHFLLAAGKITAGGMDEVDGVQGVFFVSGAGGYVSTAVSVNFSVYCLLYVKTVPLWIRIFGVACSIYQIQIADTKQVILTCGIAWLLLGLTKVQDIKKLFMYLTGIAIAIAAFIWAAYNIEAFEVYSYWFTRTDITQDPNGGPSVKMEGIKRVLSYEKNFLQTLFGLGPGHTLGRLGGWTIRDYWSMLSSLGATRHPLSDEMWDFINGNWIALTTTLFVPLFTWAGLWGDQGWVGVAAYILLGWIVWQYCCFDDFSRFLVLTVFIYGFFLTQVEEPGFMLSLMAILGLRWHEHRLQRIQKNSMQSSNTS